MTGAMGVSPDPEKRGEADRHRRYRGTQRYRVGNLTG
jgi:rRNA maturation protein Nop10